VGRTELVMMDFKQAGKAARTIVKVATKGKTSMRMGMIERRAPCGVRMSKINGAPRGPSPLMSLK
jgi:hypothetical protein